MVRGGDMVDIAGVVRGIAKGRPGGQLRSLQCGDTPEPRPACVPLAPSLERLATGDGAQASFFAPGLSAHRWEQRLSGWPKQRLRPDDHCNQHPESQADWNCKENAA